MRPFRVEKLADHDRTGFDCGVPVLNDYLQKQASQDMRRHATVCFVLIENSTDAMAGYYTLSAASVGLTDLPLATQKRMPRYPTVPAVRIGRLAMDTRFQGRQLGGYCSWMPSAEPTMPNWESRSSWLMPRTIKRRRSMNTTASNRSRRIAGHGSCR